MKILQRSLQIITCLLIVSDVSASTLRFSTATMSQSCKTIIATEVTGEGHTQLTFNEHAGLHIDSDKQVDFLQCKIFWSPDLPAGYRISGGTLKVKGRWTGGEYASVRLRLAHELLGLGQPSQVVSLEELTENFTLKLPIQNIHPKSCNLSSRLNSTISILIKLDDEIEAEQELSANLDLLSLSIEEVQLWPCAEESKQAEVD